MIAIGTIVSIKSGDEYCGKYIGKLGIVKRFMDDRVGVEFAGLKNHASKYGLFWFNKENVTPSLFDTPKRNEMSKYIQMIAAQMGKKITVPITVTNYIRLLASGGLGRSEKYLVDELQMMLSAMNVEAATVDCDCIEILRGQQKEGL